MPDGLFWNTVSPLLKDALTKLMKGSPFHQFRLVGGTSLSLQLGHRFSADIDLFTDAVYDSVDFDGIDHFLRGSFPYVSAPHAGVIGMGQSYLIGRWGAEPSFSKKRADRKSLFSTRCAGV